MKSPFFKGGFRGIFVTGNLFFMQSIYPDLLRSYHPTSFYLFYDNNEVTLNFVNSISYSVPHVPEIKCKGHANCNLCNTKLRILIVSSHLKIHSFFNPMQQGAGGFKKIEYSFQKIKTQDGLYIFVFTHAICYIFVLFFTKILFRNTGFNQIPTKKHTISAYYKYT